MTITWHGQYTVKLSSKDTTVVIDPYAPSSGLPAFRAKANIVALSNPQSDDMSHINGIQGDPMIIDSPGEYSFHGLTLQGICWIADDGSERSLQRWTIEDMAVVHVGALTREPNDAELQQLEQTNIDILLIPVGGATALTTKQALRVVSIIEPRLVIPIHYQLKGVGEKLDRVDRFAKEMGVSPRRREKKLLIRASKLPQDDMETVILQP